MPSASRPTVRLSLFAVTLATWATLYGCDRAAHAPSGAPPGDIMAAPPSPPRLDADVETDDASAAPNHGADATTPSDANDAARTVASPDAVAPLTSCAPSIVPNACPSVQSGAPIQLIRAGATSGCAGDTSTCTTTTVHLSAWIDLADLAYAKTVTLLYRAHPSDPWSQADAHYFGAADPGRQTWYAETPAVDLASIDTASFEFSLLYAVAGATYTDDCGGAPYTLAVAAGGSSMLVGSAPVALVEAAIDGTGQLVASALVRGSAAAGGQLDLVYTIDAWAHVLTAPWTQGAILAGTDVAVWSIQQALPASASKVSFALRYTDGEEVAWDNDFNRNYPRYTSPSPFVGRWDATVTTSARTYPTWFEIASACGELSGRLVGRVGSVRPIRDLEETDGTLAFALPTQYESQTGDLTFTATLAGSAISGTCSSDDGPAAFTAAVAPTLAASSPAAWSAPVALLTPDLAGWTPLDPSAPNMWQMQGDTLVCPSPGSDLASVVLVSDFQLHFEFALPAGGNSGVYLRGRYEVQLLDDSGDPPSTLGVGAIYGFLAPTVNAGLPSGAWQACDVTLVGRTVTVVLNGQTAIDGREIPGITGGAIDSQEGAPGPIVLQGDHTGVSFRNITLRTPIGQ